MNRLPRTVVSPRLSPSMAPCQLSMTFASSQLRGMSSSDRAKAVVHLASLLILAAGLEEGERDDDDV